MKFVLTLPKLVVIAFLLLATGCKEEVKLITYQYKEVSAENSENPLDEVVIEVLSNKLDAIRRLTISQYVDTASLMESNKLTFFQAQALLEEKYTHTQNMITDWEDLVSLCVECDLPNTDEKFLSISISAIGPNNKDPHLGYWERLDFDFTSNDFQMSDSKVKEILEEYRLLSSYQEKEKVMSVQSLLEDESFPLFDFFVHAYQQQVNEDGLITVISEGQQVTYQPRDLQEYDFMKAPWFSPNFVGNEFRSREGFDNVVVPWEYCIEGKYQEQLTGYWSACARVSEIVYTMFGNYEYNLPENEELFYKVVSTGYFVNEGNIAKETILNLIGEATWMAEIPTPFSLNTARLGYGFDSINLYETKSDGTEWEYDLTKTDEKGFYLETALKKNNKFITQSFTYFETSEFHKLYQSLLNQ